MRLIVQNARDLSITCDGEPGAPLEKGLFVLIGVKKTDDEKTARAMAQKLVNLRIIPDENGKLNLAVTDPKALSDILVVSNFTLYADCASSRRPGFTDSASFDEGKRIYDLFVGNLRLALSDAAANGGRKARLATGRFGSHMEIGFTAVGPVTVILDSDQPGMIKS